MCLIAVVVLDDAVAGGVDVVHLIFSLTFHGIIPKIYTNYIDYPCALNLCILEVLELCITLEITYRV